MTEDPLETITRLQAVTELELQAKGYPASMARAAVARAKGFTDHKVAPLSPEIKIQGTLDVLRYELTKAERWCQGEQRALDEPYTPGQEEEG